MTMYDDSWDRLRSGRGEAPTELTDRDDAPTIRLLSEELSRLRRARPGYEDRLEVRLVARLPEASRPWWRRPFEPRSRDHARRAGVGVQADGRAGARTSRRAFVGLATAAALAVTSLGVTSLVGRPSEVSAQEMLEKSKAFAENPFLSGVKSFHLTATVTGRLPGQDASATRTTEQWFVAPNRMRMETRSQGRDGKATVMGNVSDGTNLKSYGTQGADPLDMVGVLPAPAGPPPADGGDAVIPRADRDASPSGTTAPRREKLEGPPPTEGGGVMIVGAKPDGTPPRDGDHIVVRLDDCPPPKRQGQGTVAGRAVDIVELDHSSCLPPEVPAEMRGRHRSWVDRETFLPLKMEDYAQDGTLRHRYEVTSIEYDVAIPDSIFTEIPPAGTVLLPLPTPPSLPSGSGALPEPGVGPIPALPLGPPPAR